MKLLLLFGAVLSVSAGIIGFKLTNLKEISLFVVISIFFLVSGYFLGIGYGRKA